MDVRGSLAILAIAGAAAGCAAPAAGEDAPAEVPEREEPLSVAVDSLDVVHGAARIIATMEDGSADVEMQLGGACAHGEVGGGMSTPSRVVWALGEADLADAISCGLRLRARVREGGVPIAKVAELSVALNLEALQGSSDEDPAPATESAPIGVSNAQYARSILRGLPLCSEGSCYRVSLSIGGRPQEFDEPRTESSPDTDEPEEPEQDIDDPAS